MASKRMAVVLVVLFLSMVTATTAGNRRICGEQLADTLSLVCNGSFNKRATGVFRLKRSIATRYIKNKRVVEEVGGVVDECCLREQGCSILTLMSYCSLPMVDYNHATVSVDVQRPNEEPVQTTVTVSPSTAVMTTSDNSSPGQVFRSWRNRRPTLGRTSGGKWFFLPLQLGPSPTRRPYIPS